MVKKECRLIFVYNINLYLPISAIIFYRRKTIALHLTAKRQSLCQASLCIRPCLVLDKSLAWLLCYINYSQHKIGEFCPSWRHTIGSILRVCAIVIIFLVSILKASVSPNSHVFEPAYYGAEYIGAVSGSRNFMQCFAVLMQTRWPSYIDWRCKSLSTKRLFVRLLLTGDYNFIFRVLGKLLRGLTLNASVFPDLLLFANCSFMMNACYHCMQDTHFVCFAPFPLPLTVHIIASQEVGCTSLYTNLSIFSRFCDGEWLRAIDEAVFMDKKVLWICYHTWLGRRIAFALKSHTRIVTDAMVRHQ